MKPITKQCYECRAGEHENYDNDVEMTRVHGADSGQRCKTGFLCGEHRAAFRDDGYKVETLNS